MTPNATQRLSNDLNERRQQLLGSKLYHLCQYENKGISHHTLQRRLKHYNKMYNTLYTPEDVAKLCHMKQKSVESNRMYGGCPLTASRMYGGCPLAASRMYGGCPLAASRMYGGCPLAASKMYGSSCGCSATKQAFDV